MALFPGMTEPVPPDGSPRAPHLPAPSAYVQRLPIGRRIPFPADGIPFWESFPYEAPLEVKVLEAPVLPEPERHGEAGAQDCGCTKDPLRNVIWSDGAWSVRHTGEPPSLPAMVLLGPVAHHDLHDLPGPLAAGLGAMLQRVERAIMSLGGIGRVHVNRWGDGGAHLHYWLIGRPEGMMQLRGTCLPLWDDLLPRVPEDEWRESMRKIAASLAHDGGVSYA